MLKAHTQVQIHGVHGQQCSHIQSVAYAAQPVLLQMGPEKDQKRCLNAQQRVNNPGMPDASVSVDPGAQYRAEHCASDIARRHDDSEFRIAVAKPLQVNRRICGNHAEGHPEAACDQHIMKGHRGDPFFHVVAVLLFPAFAAGSHSLYSKYRSCDNP